MGKRGKRGEEGEERKRGRKGSETSGEEGGEGAACCAVTLLSSDGRQANIASLMRPRIEAYACWLTHATSRQKDESRASSARALELMMETISESK